MEGLVLVHYDIGTKWKYYAGATIPLNTDIKGTISSRGDNDYYQFVITTGGTITISLTTLPANYDLSLLNGSGTTLQSSANNSTASETINATVTGATFI